jgi:hypothetical protein
MVVVIKLRNKEGIIGKGREGRKEGRKERKRRRMVGGALLHFTLFSFFLMVFLYCLNSFF